MREAVEEFHEFSSQRSSSSFLVAELWLNLVIAWRDPIDGRVKLRAKDKVRRVTRGWVSFVERRGFANKVQCQFCYVKKERKTPSNFYWTLPRVRWDEADTTLTRNQLKSFLLFSTLLKKVIKNISSHSFYFLMRVGILKHWGESEWMNGRRKTKGELYWNK